jgi:predicted nucleic acid-binding protein
VILYLDTSSLVKLYVTEAHSDLVRGWTEEAEIVATCRVAYPEMISALHRRYRAADLGKKDYERLVAAFAGQWRHIAAIDFDEIAAGRLAAAHGLRGFDAVHLSACLRLQSAGNGPAVAFSSFDEKLNNAAAAEKLTVMRAKPKAATT